MTQGWFSYDYNPLQTISKSKTTNKQAKKSTIIWNQTLAIVCDSEIVMVFNQLKSCYHMETNFCDCLRSSAIKGNENSSHYSSYSVSSADVKIMQAEHITLSAIIRDIFEIIWKQIFPTEQISSKYGIFIAWERMEPAFRVL